MLSEEKLVRRMNGVIWQLAKEGVTLGKFADLIESCTKGNLIVDVRNRNGDVPLSKLGTVQSYPQRMAKRN